MLAIKKYCIVRDNEDLRELIRFKMKQQGISTTKLARDLLMQRSNLTDYLLGTDSKTVRQYDVLRIAKHLGVEVTLKFDIKK